MDFQQIIDFYTQKLETEGKAVTVNLQKTKELTNVQIELEPDLSQSKTYAPLQEDLIERMFILKKVLEAYLEFDSDLMTRRAIIYNNYDNNSKHCINSLHFYVRENQLNLNVYVRSQNFDANFVYDYATFNLAYHLMLSLISDMTDSPIQKGKINLSIMSLHRILS